MWKQISRYARVIDEQVNIATPLLHLLGDGKQIVSGRNISLDWYDISVFLNGRSASSAQFQVGHSRFSP